MKEATTMRIVDSMDSRRIQIGIQQTGKKEILGELVDSLVAQNILRSKEPAYTEFLERESKGSTGIGNGIAIPHIRTGEVSELEFFLAIEKRGVDFESLDGEPVYIIFMMMAPSDSHGIHIKALAKVSRILNDETLRVRLRNAATAQDVLNLLAEREAEIG